MPYKTRQLLVRSYHLLQYWICKSQFISSPLVLHMKHTIALFQSLWFEIEKENCKRIDTCFSLCERYICYWLSWKCQ